MSYTVETTTAENLDQWHFIESTVLYKDAIQILDHPTTIIPVGDLIRIRGKKKKHLFIADDPCIYVGRIISERVSQDLISFYKDSCSISFWMGIHSYFDREFLVKLMLSLTDRLVSPHAEVERAYRISTFTETEAEALMDLGDLDDVSIGMIGAKLFESMPLDDYPTMIATLLPAIARARQCEDIIIAQELKSAITLRMLIQKIIENQ